jgi:hypothetical protein
MGNGQPMIDVDYLGGEPTYNTLEEATAAAARKARRDDSESVKGKAIVNYQYAGESLFLLLAGGTVLKMWAGMNGVQWQVLDRHAADEVQMPEELWLRFPDGSTFKWQWKAMLDALPGSKVRYVGNAGATMAVLYVEKCPDMLFSVLIRRSSAEKFLFFSEE